MNQLLRKLGFPQSLHVEKRASIADLFAKKKRCGVYVLQFSNAEFYVGQAVDVTRRYVQHSHVHLDIEAIRFRQVPRQQLDAVERHVIETLELQGVPLRNIALTSMPGGSSDLDLVVSPHDQEMWLAGRGAGRLENKRMSDQGLRVRYRERFARLCSMSCFERDVLPVMRKYMELAIIQPYLTEASFWCCSCLPAYHNPNVVIISRLNIFWQEVFTMALAKGARNADFSFHLAQSSLEKSSRRGMSRKLWSRRLSLEDHRYRPGGADQCALHAQGRGEAMRLLDDPDIVSAIRLFNLRLMKKGPSANSRSHCMDLADAVLPRA